MRSLFRDLSGWYIPGETALLARKSTRVPPVVCNSIIC